MTITIDPKLEAQLRERAESEGITINAYLERLIHSDQAAQQEIETMALEGLNSGSPMEIGLGHWEEKHQLLDEKLKNTLTR